MLCTKLVSCLTIGMVPARSRRTLSALRNCATTWLTVRMMDCLRERTLPVSTHMLADGLSCSVSDALRALSMVWTLTAPIRMLSLMRPHSERDTGNGFGQTAQTLRALLTLVATALDFADRKLGH